jgi:hypothetical protein
MSIVSPDCAPKQGVAPVGGKKMIAGFTYEEIGLEEEKP